jgi:hypothetical protein
MGRGMTIGVAFDFRTDAKGKNPDPDKDSPTLRLYHRLLWSKPLPSGAFFDLSETTRGEYLYHRSILGEFLLIERFGDADIHEMDSVEGDHRPVS